MAKKTKTTVVEDRTAVVGFVQGNDTEITYVRSTPRAKKANVLSIKVNGDTVTLGGPQINQLRRLLDRVG